MSPDTLGTYGQIVTSLIEVGALAFAGVKFFVKLNNRLDKLEEQYKPNGGSSMRDAINRIEAKLNKLEGRFEQHVDENDD